MLQYTNHIQCFTLALCWHRQKLRHEPFKVWVQILCIFVCFYLGRDRVELVRKWGRPNGEKTWHDTENSAMYSTQCVSLNVQCTSNTIQPESRIKKVETTKEKRKGTCYKWQSPGAFFIQRRKHHAEAMERNKCLCNRRPTCPTALLLVLHITKSHVANHIFTGFSWVSLTVTIQNLPSFSPLILSSFFSLS